MINKNTFIFTIIAWSFQTIAVIIICSIDYYLRFKNGTMQQGDGIDELVFDLVRLLSDLIFIIIIFISTFNIKSPLKRIVIVIIQVIIMLLFTTGLFLFYGIYTRAIKLA
jgi:hypothetical protein